MATDLFDQLAEMDVPPPPARFDDQLHERVNRSLVVGQMLDLAFGAVPYAVAHFSRALVGVTIFTFTGRWEAKPRYRRG
jgi:hypothetical protein